PAVERPPRAPGGDPRGCRPSVGGRPSLASPRRLHEEPHAAVGVLADLRTGHAAEPCRRARPVPLLPRAHVDDDHAARRQLPPRGRGLRPRRQHRLADQTVHNREQRLTAYPGDGVGSRKRTMLVASTQIGSATIGKKTTANSSAIAATKPRYASHFGRIPVRMITTDAASIRAIAAN